MKKELVKNLAVATTAGLTAIAPEVIDFNPDHITEGAQLLVQVTSAIISLWYFIKSIFKK